MIRLKFVIQISEMLKCEKAKQNKQLTDKFRIPSTKISGNNLVFLKEYQNWTCTVYQSEEFAMQAHEDLSSNVKTPA